jgi:hypothetical protein
MNATDDFQRSRVQMHGFADGKYRWSLARQRSGLAYAAA